MKWQPGYSLHFPVGFANYVVLVYDTQILVCVNMILINMMMAIINLAFEEIKNKKDSYQNKFEIIEYIKRTTREMTGTR